MTAIINHINIFEHACFGLFNFKVSWIVQEHRTLEGRTTCLAATYDTLFEPYIALWLRNELKAVEAKKEILNDHENLATLQRYKESNELMVRELAGGNMTNSQNWGNWHFPCSLKNFYMFIVLYSQQNVMVLREINSLFQEVWDMLHVSGNFRSTWVSLPQRVGAFWIDRKDKIRWDRYNDTLWHPFMASIHPIIWQRRIIAA